MQENFSVPLQLVIRLTTLWTAMAITVNFLTVCTIWWQHLYYIYIQSFSKCFYQKQLTNEVKRSKFVIILLWPVNGRHPTSPGVSHILIAAPWHPQILYKIPEIEWERETVSRILDYFWWFNQKLSPSGMITVWIKDRKLLCM